MLGVSAATDRVVTQDHAVAGVEDDLTLQVCPGATGS
jgi:hypothetical protein